MEVCLEPSFQLVDPVEGATERPLEKSKEVGAVRS